jgi:hypothetical protein
VTEQQLLRMPRCRLVILGYAGERTGKVALTCRYFGIDRQMLSTWLCYALKVFPPAPGSHRPRARRSPHSGPGRPGAPRRERAPVVLSACLEGSRGRTIIARSRSSKGSRVVVVGRLQQRSWTAPKRIAGVYNVGGGPHFGSGLTIDTAAEQYGNKR